MFKKIRRFVRLNLILIPLVSSSSCTWNFRFKKCCFFQLWFVLIKGPFFVLKAREKGKNCQGLTLGRVFRECRVGRGGCGMSSALGGYCLRMPCINIFSLSKQRTKNSARKERWFHLRRRRRLGSACTSKYSVHIRARLCKQFPQAFGEMRYNSLTSREQSHSRKTTLNFK